jgi:hypothetical protein
MNCRRAGIVGESPDYAEARQALRLAQAGQAPVRDIGRRPPPPTPPQSGLRARTAGASPGSALLNPCCDRSASGLVAVAIGARRQARRPGAGRLGLADERRVSRGSGVGLGGELLAREAEKTNVRGTPMPFVVDSRLPQHRHVPRIAAARTWAPSPMGRPRLSATASVSPAGCISERYYEAGPRASVTRSRRRIRSDARCPGRDCCRSRPKNLTICFSWKS